MKNDPIIAIYLIIQYLIYAFQVPSVTIGNSGDIDVEGLDDEEMGGVSTSRFLGGGGGGEIDILRQDLQYSSSSSNDEDSDIEDV